MQPVKFESKSVNQRERNIVIYQVVFVRKCPQLKSMPQVAKMFFPDFSSIWVIYSSELRVVKEKITRLGVWREKMTHIDEKSGQIFSPLGARVWAEGIFILWGSLFLSQFRLEIYHLLVRSNHFWFPVINFPLKIFFTRIRFDFW